MLDTRKIMKQIERNTKKFLNEFQMFGEEEENQDVEQKPTPEPKPQMPPTETPENDVPEDNQEPIEEPVEEPTQEPTETPDENIEQKPEEDKGMSLSNDHKERINKWLLTNKKLNAQSFEGLISQMEVKKTESFNYVFMVAREYLQKTIEKATK